MDRPFNFFSLYSFVKTLRISFVIGGWILFLSTIAPNPVWADGAANVTQTHESSPIGVTYDVGEYDVGEYDVGEYTYRNRPSSDGIGKVYLGREIAQVMGHRGAAWLERASRIQEEKPHVLMANLDIKPTDIIADMGAGTGYLTVRLAPKVPHGKVLAVDIQSEMLDMLGDRLSQRSSDNQSPEDGLNNVELILASETDPHLPSAAVDMAIMLDVYHELAYPYEIMQKVVRSLRPGGKMVLVEYRGENPLVPIKRLHKMTERQVRKEMKAVGLTWIETNEELPRQHLMIFEKDPGDR